MPGKTRKTNRVNDSGIPVADLDRAMALTYTAVFGAPLERTEVDGIQNALFPARDGAVGISGGLENGKSYVPGKQGARLYFGAPEIDETLRQVERAGGNLPYPKTAIGAIR